MPFYLVYQHLFNFWMTGNGSWFAIIWIGINVMSTEVSLEITTPINQFSNKVSSFHTSIPIFFR
ncbi:hypothetical protein BGS_0501 [Beggiatoa sp. SS]|nr:hypothetical protein BGS_0501 [Beggiatoa sp. SS]